MYENWTRKKLILLTDAYRDLAADCEVAEIAFRLLSRRPDLFSETEAREVEQRLAVIYDTVVLLELEDGVNTNCENAPVDPWPVLADDALHGLAGDVVRAIDPYTEAVSVATLLTLFDNVRQRDRCERAFPRRIYRALPSLVRNARRQDGQRTQRAKPLDPTVHVSAN